MNNIEVQIKIFTFKGIRIKENPITDLPASNIILLFPISYLPFLIIITIFH